MKIKLFALCALLTLFTACSGRQVMRQVASAEPTEGGEVGDRPDRAGTSAVSIECTSSRGETIVEMLLEFRKELSDDQSVEVSKLRKNPDRYVPKVFDYRVRELHSTAMYRAPVEKLSLAEHRPGAVKLVQGTEGIPQSLQIEIPSIATVQDSETQAPMQYQLTLTVMDLFARERYSSDSKKTVGFGALEREEEGGDLFAVLSDRLVSLDGRTQERASDYPAKLLCRADPQASLVKFADQK